MEPMIQWLLVRGEFCAAWLQLLPCFLSTTQICSVIFKTAMADDPNLMVLMQILTTFPLKNVRRKEGGIAQRNYIVICTKLNPHWVGQRWISILRMSNCIESTACMLGRQIVTLWGCHNKNVEGINQIYVFEKVGLHMTLAHSNKSANVWIALTPQIHIFREKKKKRFRSNYFGKSGD